MQGQRSLVGSVHDSLDIDQGSASGNSILDQQVHWNHIQDPSENRLNEFTLPSSYIDDAYASSGSQGQQSMAGWTLGEPSSSGTKDEVSCDEKRTLQCWSSSTSDSADPSAKLEEKQSGPTNVLSLDRTNRNSEFVQSSPSNAVPRNLNLNISSQGSEDFQVIEDPNRHTPSTAGCGNIAPDDASGIDGILMEENDGRPVCSLDCGHRSCKRKAVDVNAEPSFLGGSSSGYAGYDGSSSLSVPAQLEQTDARLELNMRALGRQIVTDTLMARRGESSRRNLRLRINPPNVESTHPSTIPIPSAVRRSAVSAPDHSPRPFAFDNSLEFRLSPAIDGPNREALLNVNPVHRLAEWGQSARLDGSSSSRGGGLSGSVTLGEREGTSSRSWGRNRWEQPIFVPTPESRSSIRLPPIRVEGSQSTTDTGNVASASRTGSGSGMNPIHSDPPSDPHPNFPVRYPRRLADYVRHSLLALSDSESPDHSGDSMPHSGSPIFSEETTQSTGAGGSGLHRANSSLSSWLERHRDAVLGNPRTFRDSEGRTRIVSEIRNVLDLMRRGEGFRIEDVVILDESGFFGVADIHDRHRDMRLDVDNMSYEELLALEERIGNVSTGLSEETILNHLKQHKYAVAIMTADVENEPCCICREEYNDGEDIGTLDCSHDFHTDCIKQWLMQKNLCPICKMTGLAKCERDSNN